MKTNTQTAASPLCKWERPSDLKRGVKYYVVQAVQTLTWLHLRR